MFAPNFHQDNTLELEPIDDFAKLEWSETTVDAGSGPINADFQLSPSHDRFALHNHHQNQDYVSLQDLELLHAEPSDLETLSLGHDGDVHSEFQDGTHTFMPNLCMLDTSPTLDPPQLSLGYTCNWFECSGRGQSTNQKRSYMPRGMSAIEGWLRDNGLTTYPDTEQIGKLAVADGKTTRQARIKLNNLRARMKSG